MANKILAQIEPGGLGPITLAGTVECGDLVGYSAGWVVAKQATAAIPAVGVVDRAGVSGKIVQLHTRGVVRGASGLTPGAPVYLGEGGEVSASAGAHFAQVVGIAISATEWVIAINAGVGANPSATIADAGLTAAADIVAAAAATATAIAASVPSDAPAGGTGAAEGAYDTAANRDLAIATINGLVAHATEMNLDYEALLVDVADIRTKYAAAVTLANELKADYNATVALFNAALVALEAHGIVVKA